MKYFILSLIFSLSLGASTLSKYRSTSDGVSSQKFIFDDKIPTFEKTSNYFDLKHGDYGIGIHKLSKESSEYKNLVKEVEEYAKKFKTVDEFLKTKGSSFNEVSGLIKHESIIMVDDYRIKPDSKYYASLDALFKKFQGMGWKLTKGYRISNDLERILEFDKGKEIKSSLYSKALYCQKLQPPTTCTYFGGGQVYVK